MHRTAAIPLEPFHHCCTKQTLTKPAQLPLLSKRKIVNSLNSTRQFYSPNEIEWSPDKSIFPHCPLGLLLVGFWRQKRNNLGLGEERKWDRFPHLCLMLCISLSLNEKKVKKRYFLQTRLKRHKMSYLYSTMFFSE